MTITLQPYHIIVPFVLVGIMVLLAMIWIIIENILFNIQMNKIWREQEYRLEDLKKCPGCGYPQLFGHIKNSGLPILVSRKYYTEKFSCRCCCHEFEFVVKFDGYNGDYQ